MTISYPINIDKFNTQFAQLCDQQKASKLDIGYRRNVTLDSEVFCNNISLII